MSRDKCYFLVSPNAPLALCQVSSLKAVTVEVDRYRRYGHPLDYVLPSCRLLGLSTTTGAILYPDEGSKSGKTVLDSCQHWNLSHGIALTSKLKPYPIPKPVYAATASVALVRSGNFQVHDFTEHLRIYFSSPKILFPGQIIALKIPQNVPTTLSIEEFLQFAANNPKFIMDTYTVHFKAQEAKDSNGNHLTDFFLISSAKTTLYQVSDEHCRIPREIENKIEDLFYVSERTKCLKILGSSPRGALLIIGGKGSCKAAFVGNLGGYTQQGLYHVRGVEYCGEAASSLQTKLTHLLEHITKCVPCLVYLDHVELVGRTRDGSGEDARVVMCWQELFEALSELDVTVVTSCSNPTDIVTNVKFLFNSVVRLDTKSESESAQLLKKLVRFRDDVDVERIVMNKLRHASLHQLEQFVEATNRRLNSGYISGDGVSEQEAVDVIDEDVFTLQSGSVVSLGIPDTSWSDIGGIDHVRKEVEETIEIPLKHPEVFGGGIRRSGLLLYGAPGCGKTMVAKAIASQCNLHFISIQGPELLNSFVGQSEDNIRQLFDTARKMAPTVLFFDEIDAIASKRTGGVMDRVLAQILSEMDGIKDSGNVFMIGATNRPELLDPAITRPGRLDKRVRVAVGGDVDSREQVFKALSRKLKVDTNVNFKTVSEISGPLSGAECFGMLLEACYVAIERCINSKDKTVTINQNDLLTVIMNKK